MPSSDLTLDLQRARTSLVEAELAERPSERYLAAQAGALRVAAVVLVLKAQPARSARRARPRNAWELVAEVAPELSEWAGFFAATQGTRDAVKAGATSIVSARQADDLVRDVGAFLALVERAVHQDPRVRSTKLTAGPSRTAGSSVGDRST